MRAFQQNSSSAFSFKSIKVTTYVRQLFWYAYLLMLAFISFANTPINSTLWVTIYAFLFLYAGLYCGFISFFDRTRFKGIHASRFALFWLVLMLLWMCLQQVIEGDSYLKELVFDHSISADWFRYKGLLSVAPERASWVILGNTAVVTLFVLTLLLLDTRRRVRELMWLLLFVGLIHASIDIFAKYAGLYFVDKVALDGHFRAARGVFVNRNHLAAFIILCLCPAVVLQTRLLIKNKVDSVQDFFFKQIIQWSFLFFLVGFTCVFLAESRAAILSLPGCIGFYFFVLFRRAKVVNSSVKHHYLTFGLIGLSIIIVLWLGQGMIQRFLVDGLAIGERSLQWSITLQAIKHEFFIGYGVGSYELVFQTFRGYADLRAAIYDQAHNDYLHILLEQGFIGIFIWFSFIVSVFCYAAKNYIKTKSSLTCAILFSGLIVVSAVLLQSLVSYPLQIMTIRSYFFVIIALIFAVPTVRHR